MKTSYAIGLVVVSVLVTLTIEESRIATMRTGYKTSLAAAANMQTAAICGKPPLETGESPAGPVKTKSRTEMKPATPVKAGESDDESFAKTARKMWDNPAGKSMMNQGIKIAVAMTYQNFIDGLKLSKEEGEYMKTLLCKQMSDQQELGMKMLGASAEEQTKLAEEITQREKDNEEDIKKFLNSEDDFKSYTDYKKRMPEHQQLEGIRSAMTSKGTPLDAATETRLVDAMYRARTESKAPDLSGTAGIEALASGNIVETYEKSWQIQQDALQKETSKILNETQQAAFQEYQKQAKEMQLMGLKMAEKMMPSKK